MRLSTPFQGSTCQAATVVVEKKGPKPQFSAGNSKVEWLDILRRCLDAAYPALRRTRSLSKASFGRKTRAGSIRKADSFWIASEELDLVVYCD